MRSFGFVLLVLAFSGAMAAEVKTVRTWSEPPRTRVVFDVTDAVDYSVFTMRHPDRVVVDIRGTRTPRRLQLPDARSRTLKRLRYAARNGDGLRIVIDLERPVAVEDALLAPNREYGHRLVLDLTERGAPSPGLARRPEQLAAAPTPAPQPQPTVEPITATPERGRDVVVAIDPGHGGQDVGAIGPSGVYEKDITLAVARDLAELINARHGMRAILTREADRYLKLRERMDRAREHRADLFISVHADAFRDRRVRGSSVYVLSQRGASSEAAKWLADHENAADLIGGVTLDDKDDVLKSVLIDLSQTASIEASIDVGRHVLDALRQLGPVHKKRVQHAGFMVLKSPDIPSILVETAFISNPTEEKRLRSTGFRRRLAGAMLDGVEQYFQVNPPPGTRLAEQRRHTVIRGDTLSAIAARYDVSIDSIKLANNLATELVRTGEVLQIP